MRWRRHLAALATRKSAALPALLMVVACVGEPPLPLALPPAHAVALPAVLCDETLAIQDFVDARPDFERSDAEIDEHFIGGRWLARDRFWAFHAIGGDLKEDPAIPPDLHARVTGTAAFAWYPFPNQGVGKPGPAPVSLGMADYVALHFEQRGVFARVVRVRDAEQAKAAGATLLLTGRIDRFGAMLAQAHDPYSARPDDGLDFRLVAAADYQVELRRITGDELLLARECLGRDESYDLSDELTPFRGPQPLPGILISQARFPRMAEADLANHGRRSLERATVPLVAAVEERLRQEPRSQ
jgi:hypothetical protein